jgi:uncharacterized membrane protein YfhO
MKKGLSASSIFHRKGWKVYIDGKKFSIIPDNYILAGLSIPENQQVIKFEFCPASFYTDESLTKIANIFILHKLLSAAFYFYKVNKKRAEA